MSDLDRSLTTRVEVDEKRESASYLARQGDFNKCLLLFSGGLDTSVMVKWIGETYNCDVYTFTANVGQQEDFERLERKAYALGAKRHFYHDARQELVEDFCWPAIKANATFGRNGHPLSSSLTRPLIVKHAIAAAKVEGISVLAHGASGKSNDSLRFDTAALTLAPSVRVLAPVRERSITREAEMVYAQKHGIDVTATPQHSYSIDDNIWARETEVGKLLRKDYVAHDEVFSLVPPTNATPDSGTTIDVDFVAGQPVGVNGKRMPPLAIVQALNHVATEHGVGRHDHMEDRGIGVKVREIHEAPAAEVLIRAHADLQALTLTREELRFSRIAEIEWVENVLSGFWYTPLMGALNAFFDESQKRVTGSITLRLHRGHATVVARHSPYALDTATLVEQGFFSGVNESATASFIEVSGLQRRASRWMADRAARHAT